MNIPSIHHFIVPNIIALIFILPTLTTIFLLTIILSSLLTTITFYLDTAIYYDELKTTMKTYILYMPIIKAIVNSLLIGVISTYIGYVSQKNKDISYVTNRAVIYSFITCLFSNVIVSSIIINSR